MSQELAAGLNWLLNHSLQAGVLVLLVLLVQWIFRRQLTHRWRFLLWWIVLLRLLLPFGPESSVSLFNVVRPAVRLPLPNPPAPLAAAPAAQIDASPSLPVDFGPAENPPDLSDKISPSATPITPAPAPIIRPRPAIGWSQWLIPGLTGLWLAGVLALAGVVAAQLLRFHRRLARTSVPAEARLGELLADCRREFPVTRRIELLETDSVQSPALFGLFRLRLLLPRGIGRQFGRAELRYIFLHELAHVKRGDLWLNWLVTGLQILHWFNPLVWLGFARLRADRELACDELALLRAGDQAGTAYGETVVKLLEHLSRPTAIPGLVGILEDCEQMHRRIAMIANFRRPGPWSVLAVLLVGTLAATALTDARSDNPPVTFDSVDDVGNRINPKGVFSDYDQYFTPVNSFPYMSWEVKGAGFTNHLNLNVAWFKKFAAAAAPQNWAADLGETNPRTRLDLADLVAASDGATWPDNSYRPTPQVDSGKGRTVVGRFETGEYYEPAITDFARGRLEVDSTTPNSQAPEFQLRPDGSFSAKDVPAGQYELVLTMPANVDQMKQLWSHYISFGSKFAGQLLAQTNRVIVYHSHLGMVVPPAQGDLDNSVVDWGRVQMLQPQILIAGAEAKGIVLAPDGTLAAGAEVALQTADEFPQLGDEGFKNTLLRRQGLLVNAGADGGFALPMDETAATVIALNEQGFAQVALEQFLRSPQITLQKWGRIEGTLSMRGHPGTNELVEVTGRQGWSLPHDASAPEQGGSPAKVQQSDVLIESLQSTTDDQGHFVITNVPPGEQTLCWYVSAGSDSWSPRKLATVDVKPGSTLVTNINAESLKGRTIIGRVKFSGGEPRNWVSGDADIMSPSPESREQRDRLKTAAERTAFDQSPAVQALKNNPRRYTFTVQPDGSFRAEYVAPGDYGFVCTVNTRHPDYFPYPVSTNYFSAQEVVIPEARGKNDDSIVNLGTVEVASLETPVARPGTNTVTMPQSSRVMPSTQADDAGTPTATNSPSISFPGNEIKGIVLRPDGMVETNAQVALQIKGEWLSLGQKAQVQGGQTNFYLKGDFTASTSPSGNFILPVEPDAQSVAAVSAAGYAQVSLEQLRQSPQITLQKWGRLEGVLHHGHELGTNQNLGLSAWPTLWHGEPVPNMLTPPIYEESFTSITDEHGRFVFPQVPPGGHFLGRGPPKTDKAGHRWSRANQLGSVVVPAGATLVINLGGTGRTVIGRLKFSEGLPPGLTNGILVIAHPLHKWADAMDRAKTTAERLAISESKEFQRAYRDFHAYMPEIQPDGTFRAEEVSPGSYEAELLVRNLSWNHDDSAKEFDVFTFGGELIVPPGKSDQDDSVVDLGDVEMVKGLGHPTNGLTAPQSSRAVPKSQGIGTDAAVSTNSPSDLIPGAHVEGVVLNPDGEPAADAQVAIQTEHGLVRLHEWGWGGLESVHDGRGVFQTKTRSDGSFTLPMYRSTRAVVAANHDGYAQVSLEQFLVSQKITLQKWGHIEGTLRVGQDLGTNKIVSVALMQEWWFFLGITNVLRPLSTDSPVFETRTDDHGRFALNLVPPGLLSIGWKTKPGESYGASHLATVEVKPGATVFTNLGGTGRTITGRMTFGGDGVPVITNGTLSLTSLPSNYEIKILLAKTADTRLAISRTKEFQEMTNNLVGISLSSRPDGSFRADEVPPGQYELQLEISGEFDPSIPFHVDHFYSSRKVIVPAGTDERGVSLVDLGNVGMVKWVKPASIQLTNAAPDRQSSQATPVTPAAVSGMAVATNSPSNLGETGRTVIGRLEPDGAPITDFSKGRLILEPIKWKGMPPELPLAPDGSFSADDVASGSYELELTMPADLGHTNKMRFYYSYRELWVPPVQQDEDNSVVDWGRVQMSHEETLVPRTEAKGRVLRPDGTPAADATVAMMVESVPTFLENGVLIPSDRRREVYKAFTGTDGSFTLPMYEDSRSLVAVTSEGYAQVSVDQLKQSPKIILQKWGRIEGVLHVGRELGANQTVVMDSVQSRLARWRTPHTLEPPHYNFRSVTDDQGRFLFTNVPPGTQILSRRTQGLRGDARNWSEDHQLAIVDVAPGQTVVTNVGGRGRTVVGRLKSDEMPAQDFTNGLLGLNFPMVNFVTKMTETTTERERQALVNTEEFQTIKKNLRYFAADWQADGSFRADEVAPGHYELHLMMPKEKFGDNVYASVQELIVPPGTDGKDDSVVDLGEVELTKWVQILPATNKDLPVW